MIRKFALAWIAAAALVMTGCGQTRHAEPAPVEPMVGERAAGMADGNCEPTAAGDGIGGTGCPTN